MNIQFINGGLANQVFQYIFLRHAELAHPGCEPWYLDDSFFYVNQIHNGYEMENVFGIKANLLSQTFDADVWDEFIKNKKEGISVPQTLKNFGTDITMYAETDNYTDFNPFDGKIMRMFPANEFHPEITAFDLPNVYYHGYWINKNWLNTYRDIILSELSFKQMTSPLALSYADRIMTEPSVAIHIRRGDYVTIGWSMQNEYYYHALEQLSKDYQTFTAFVFSDDLDWCEEHAKELGLHFAPKTVYVSGNTGTNSYLDLQLMSMCQGLIMSNSAFCYLAALMNKRLAFYLNPTQREV